MENRNFYQMIFAYGQAHAKLNIVRTIIRDERIPSYDLACILEAVLEGEDDAEENAEA